MRANELPEKRYKRSDNVLKVFDVVFKVTGRFRVRASADTLPDAIKAASQAAQKADLRKLTDIQWELVNWTIKDKEDNE